MDKTTMAINTYSHIVDEYTKYLEEENISGELPCQKEIDYIVSILPNKSNILDVGTAMGHYPKYLTEKCNKDFDVIGIDASDKMIEKAILKAPKASFEVTDIRDMKYDDKSFDCIICFSTLIHLNDKDCLNALNTFNKILKDDGILAINVMEHLNGNKEIVIQEPFNNDFKMYYNRYSKTFFTKFLEENNFIILKIIDNPIFNEDEIGDDLVGTSEFSIIARKSQVKGGK